MALDITDQVAVYKEMFGGKDKNLTNAWNAVAEMVKTDPTMQVLSEKTEDKQLSLSAARGTFKVHAGEQAGTFNVRASTSEGAKGVVLDNASALEVADELIEYIKRNKSVKQTDGSMRLNH